jgi:D-sedoheptulose 7-phosphate isomerase
MRIDYATLLKENLRASILAKEALPCDAEQVGIFSRAAEEVVQRYRMGGRIYNAGNGGSPVDAQHPAAEFDSKLARDMAPLPAKALTTDTSVLTAIENDYGYEHVFSRQITGKARQPDVFLGITTSGRSANILNALEQCRVRSVLSIVFCGRDGGPAKALADYCVIAPGEATSTIQEVHIVLAHTLCECVECEVLG